MRRFLVISAVLTALTVPLAQAGTSQGDGTLSVKKGRGQLMLKLKGTVIGRVNTAGRVQIRDFKPFDANDPQLTCKPKAKHPSFGVSVCTGRNIVFRVNDGRFNVTVKGNGISISAVGRGAFDVDGSGETGVPDGLMSIDNAPYQSLPDAKTTFYLGTPPSQPLR
jgi:hypothetical protein